MKNTHILMVCIVMILIVESCKKNTAEEPIIIKSFSPTTGQSGNIVRIVGSGFGNSASASKIFFNGVAAVINSLNDTLIATTVPPNVTSGKISFTLDGRSATSTNDFVLLPGSWVRKADAPFLPRGLASEFTIGNKGFVGAGISGTYDSIRNFSDWWEYDPAVDQWTSRAAIPFSAGFTQGASFGINDKGYLGAGISNFIPTKELWQYDTTTNIWVRKTDYASQGFYAVIGLSTGNKGYVGAVTNSYWWEYDPAIDQWTQKSDYPGDLDINAKGLVINTKIYYGLVGGVGWWEYDPAADHWTRKSDYPGSVIQSVYGSYQLIACFTIANKGYVIASTECWAYDPALDLWTRQAFFTDYRSSGVAFSIGRKGYYTTGSDLQGNDKNDLWEFTPSN
jgi:hypothetical protein